MAIRPMRNLEGKPSAKDILAGTALAQFFLAIKLARFGTTIAHTSAAIGPARFRRTMAVAAIAVVAFAIACGGGGDGGEGDRSPTSGPTPTLSASPSLEVPDTPDPTRSGARPETSTPPTTPRVKTDEDATRAATATRRSSTPTPPSTTHDAQPITLNLDELGVPICNTSLRGGALPGFGTVPVPTPTPTPTPQVTPTPRSGDAAGAEVAAYLREIAPVLRAAVHWVDLTEQGWAEDGTLEGRAALVFAESRRVAALCNAVALLEKGVVESLGQIPPDPPLEKGGLRGDFDTVRVVSVPPEVKAEHARLAKALNDRQFWAGEAASLARSEGRISTSDLEASRRETAETIADLRHVFRGLAEEYELRDSLFVIRDSSFDPTDATDGMDSPDASSNDESRLLRPERGRVEMVVPEGWIVSRADSQSVLIAPLALQKPGLKGLGLAREGYGTALRVRRIRNAPDWTLSDAIENLRPLLIEYGEVGSEAAIMVDGYQGVQQRIGDPELEWVTRLDIVLAGEFTFFIEMGCPEAFDDKCAAALESFVQGVKLVPE